MSWHERVFSMLKCKTATWSKFTDWLTSRKEKRIPDGTAREEYRKTKEHDKYVLEKKQFFQIALKTQGFHYY